MNITELQRALTLLRLSGMAAALESRLLESQTERSAPIDLVAALVQDELTRRADRLIVRRVGQAGFRDAGKTLDTFDFDFNKKINRKALFEMATGRFVTAHEDVLLLGPPGHRQEPSGPGPGARSAAPGASRALPGGPRAR